MNRRSTVLFLALLAATGGCTQQARRALHLSRGEHDFKAEKYEEAEIEYRAVLMLAPFDPTATRQMGLLYYNDGLLVRAFPYLLKVAQSKQKDVEVQLKLAMTYLSLGSTRDAVATAKKVLELRPGDEDAMLLLCETARASTGIEETRRLIEGMRQKDTDRGSYHLALGTLLFLQQDQGGAQREFQQALQLDPKSGAAFLAMANLYLQRHDLKQAGAALQKAAGLSPLRSPRRIRYIQFELRSGTATQGKADLAEILAKAPDYVPALVFAVNLALDERRFEDCAGLIQRILSRDPLNYDALLERGSLEFERGDIPASAKDLELADSIYPRSPQLKLQLARVYLRSGDSARAENRLSQAINLEPDLDPAIMLMAELQIRKADFTAASGSLTDVVRRRPNLEPAYLLLARADLAENNFDGALDLYRRAEALFPRDPQAPYWAGCAFLRRNRPEEAYREFEKSVAIEPRYQDAQKMLVELDLRAGRGIDALKRVYDLIEKYPLSAVPLILRSEVRVTQHDLAGAEDDLSQAIELEPKSQSAYVLLARLYLLSHDRPRALDQLTKLAGRTSSSNALLQIGMIHANLKEYDAARTAYEKVLATEPRFVPALINLANLYGDDLGNLDRAYEMAERARAAAPEDPSAADALGWILCRRGEYRDALVLEQEAAEKVPNDPDVEDHAGVAYYMMGEEESARAAFQSALASAVDSPSKEDARRHLARLDLDISTAGPAARADLQAQLRAEPKDAVATARLAEIEARDGHPAEAAAGLESALKLSPRSNRIMIELATLYSGPIPNPARARELLASAHQIAPDDPAISRQLALTQVKLGAFPESLALLQEVARRLPNDPEVLLDLGWAYYRVGQIALAQSTLQTALAFGGTFPGRADAERFAAMISGSQSPALAKGALPAAQETLATVPGDLPATMIVAVAQEGQGDYAGAGRTYEAILAADPLFVPAMRNLAHLYAQHLGEDQKALVLAEKAKAAFPDDADLVKTLGILSYRSVDYAGAARYFQQSLTKQASDPETHYYLGMADYQLKANSESRVELARALQGTLDPQEADEAKRVIDELSSGSSGGSSLISQPIN